jgi:hypothetical protein
MKIPLAVTIPEQTTAIGEFIYMLRNGGTLGATLQGLLVALTAWGWFNVITARNRRSNVLQAVASLLPAGLGLLGIHEAYQQQIDLTFAPVPPKPYDLAANGAYAIAVGFWSIVATIIPYSLAIIAMGRGQNLPTAAANRPDSSAPEID